MSAFLYSHRWPGSPRWAGAVVFLAAAACSDVPTTPARTAPTSPLTGQLERTRSGPVRGRIAYSSSIAGGDLEIFTVNEDGSGLVRLTYNDGQDMQPTWSPDGKKIAYVSNRAGTLFLFVMNADGSGAKQLTTEKNGLLSVAEPAWSPDGKTIAFTGRISNGDYELFLIGPTGNGLTQVTNEPGMNLHASWSPDGTRLAFTRFAGFASPQAFAINVDGTGEGPLVPCDACGYPHWSPDGAWVLYEVVGGIRRYSPTRQLDLALITGFGGTWSPDGAKIVYYPDAYTNQIWVVNADGTDPKPVAPTGLQWFGADAEWGRAP